MIRSAWRRAVVGIAALVLAGGLAVVLSDSSPGHHDSAGPLPPKPKVAAGSSGRGLPFVHPAKSALQNSPHKVFAHYFPPFPVSLDNKPADRDYYSRQYLTAAGESGKHASYGGFLRDRPLPRRPLPGNWRLTDMQTEVSEAAGAGIDGFTVDILSFAGPNWDRVQRLLQAARSVPGFVVLAMPDMAALTSTTASHLAAALASFANAPAAFKLADGRLVVSPFAAEKRSPAWWSDVISLLHTKYRISVAFVPTFLGWRDSAAAFRSISYGFSDWGHRNPAQNSDLTRDASDVHAMGKIWMQPVSVQDERPDQGIYDEADNSANLRTTWQAAIDGGADWVQLTTWNDFSEGTEFEPSVDAGSTWLDISAYYIARFKTGSWPALTGDVGYLVHRIQPIDAKPTGRQTVLMKLRPGSSPPRDDVEALVFLVAPATVELDVGGSITDKSVPAGVSSVLAPLRAGTISLRIRRNGADIASVNSPFEVSDKPARQDLQYYAVATS